MRYNIKIVQFSLVSLLFLFSVCATADTYPFSIASTFRDSDGVHPCDIFNSSVNSIGTINDEATWTGSAANLTLILNEPGQIGYYTRKNGPSPLSLSYNTADLSKGTDRRLSIVNFGCGDPTGTVTTTYPTGPEETPLSYIYIDIDSTPQGAQIWIDGVNTGELTPYREYFDKLGKHTIELILNGYQPYQESFDISESITRNATLIPIEEPIPFIIENPTLIIVTNPPPYIYINIDSTPKGAQIWIDRVNTGELTPYRKYFDRSGEHTIELILNGYQPYQESFDISESITRNATLIPVEEPIPFIIENPTPIIVPTSPSYIYIDIDSTPQGAQIWIDGVNTGELTPYREYFDKPGKHTIGLILNGYQPYQESFDILESITRKVTLKSLRKPTLNMPPDPTQTHFQSPGFSVQSLLIAIFVVNFLIFKNKR